MADPNSGIHVHPTAWIHPTVLLEGNVTIGAYTKIDAGTVITGNVTIGHHSLVRCNVVIRGRNRIGNYGFSTICAVDRRIGPTSKNLQSGWHWT